MNSSGTYVEGNKIFNPKEAGLFADWYDLGGGRADSPLFNSVWMV